MLGFGDHSEERIPENTGLSLNVTLPPGQVFEASFDLLSLFQWVGQLVTVAQLNHNDDDRNSDEY